IGSKFIDLIPVHHRDAALSHVKSLLLRPRTEINEHEVIKADGTIGWQQRIDHVISSKEPLELQGIGRDVTELRMSLLAIQESEERFSKAFKANPQPMSLTTLAEGRYLEVNDSFLRM